MMMFTIIYVLLQSENFKRGGSSYTNPQAASSADLSSYDDSSEPAREFDGTYSVKPKVFGTYSSSSQDSPYRGGQSGQSGNSREDISRQDGYREGAYDRGDIRQNSAGGRGNFRDRGEYGDYDGRRNEGVAKQRNGQGYRDDYPQRGQNERYDSYEQGGRDNFPPEGGAGRKYGDGMGGPRDYRYPPHPVERMGGAPPPYQGEDGYAGAGGRDYRRGGPGSLREDEWDRQERQGESA